MPRESHENESLDFHKTLFAHIKSKEDYEDIIAHLDSLQYHLDILRLRSTTEAEALACGEMELGVLNYRKALTRKL